MTTIAYDHVNKRIAVDGRAQMADVILTDSAIKWLRQDDELWIFCGLTADFEDLAKLKHNDKPDVLPDCEALMVKQGKVYLVSFNQGYCCYTECQYNIAKGSGWKFALAALQLGKTAVEAVSLASTLCVYTGGVITEFDTTTGEQV